MLGYPNKWESLGKYSCTNIDDVSHITWIFFPLISCVLNLHNLSITEILLCVTAILGPGVLLPYLNAYQSLMVPAVQGSVTVYQFCKNLLSEIKQFVF